MTTLKFVSPGFWGFLDLASWRRIAATPKSQVTGTTPRDDCTGRALIDEMLTRNPDASSSELDVQSMMD